VMLHTDMLIISFFGDTHSTKIFFQKWICLLLEILCNIWPKKGNDRQIHVTLTG
jgi:hypothetical protein